MKHNQRKVFLPILAVLLAFLALFALVSRLLEPKYMTELVEGSMLSQYYAEADEGHDVIFLGDCEVYANFTPMELWRSRGITAYVRGSSQQLIWQSYYILRETLRYEKPKAVVYNVNAMRYGKPVSEAYNRLTIDKLRWSADKVGIIQASMMEEESFLSYVFPILRYHSRFEQLTGEDVQYLFQTRQNTWNGHLVNQNVKPMTTLPAKRVLASYAFPEICYDYLDKIRQLCEENGVELILIKAPSQYPYWYEEYDAQIAQYAKTHQLTYYNLVSRTEEIGLDFQQDTYDAGQHLNLRGATKLSVWFAQILADRHGIPDRRSEAAVAAHYNEKLKAYDLAIQP